MTLDISSAADNSESRQRKKPSGPSLKPATPSSEKAATEEPNGADKAQSIIDALEEIPETTSGPDSPNDTTPAPDPEDRIQILDFHTANPIISYQNQFYSCEWTSTIGTDLLFTAPDPDFPHEILQQAPGVSLLGKTGIKLFARPIQLTTRTGLAASEAITAPESSSAPGSSSAAVEASVPQDPNSAGSEAGQKQPSFLERFAAIKVAKGEKDKVPLHVPTLLEAQNAERSGRGARGRGRGRGRPRTARARTGREQGVGSRIAKGGMPSRPPMRQWGADGPKLVGEASATPEGWDRLAGRGRGAEGSDGEDEAAEEIGIAAGTQAGGGGQHELVEQDPSGSAPVVTGGALMKPQVAQENDPTRRIPGSGLEELQDVEMRDAHVIDSSEST